MRLGLSSAALVFSDASRSNASAASSRAVWPPKPIGRAQPGTALRLDVFDRAIQRPARERHHRILGGESVDPAGESAEMGMRAPRRRAPQFLAILIAAGAYREARRSPAFASLQSCSISSRLAFSGVRPASANRLSI
jgi:hypothetical protein